MPTIRSNRKVKKIRGQAPIPNHSYSSSSLATRQFPGVLHMFLRVLLNLPEVQHSFLPIHADIVEEDILESRMSKTTTFIDEYYYFKSNLSPRDTIFRQLQPRNNFNFE